MDKPRSASDKIRPFLEAMERSINRVRHQRLEESGEVKPASNAPASNGYRAASGMPGSSSSPAIPGRPAPQPSPASPLQGGGHTYAAPQRPTLGHDDAVIGAPSSPHRSAVEPAPQAGGENTDKPQRLKAKPKRPSTYSDAAFEANRYRSQAG
jgi:hypothetical protein